MWRMLDWLLDQLNGCSREPRKHFGIRIHLQVSLSELRGVGTAALQHCSTAALQPSQYHSEWLGCTLAVPGVVYTAKYICPSLQAGYWVLCGTVAGNCLNRNDKSTRLTDQHLGHLFSVQKQVKVPSWSSQVPPSWQGEEAQPSWPRSSIVNTCTSSILTRAVND